MKIAIVLGTRPEIIKCSPLIRLLEKRNVELILVHSNQHYSKNMDSIFFEELQLPQPQYNLEIGLEAAGSHSQMMAALLLKLEPVFMKEKPDWVLVQGDTNTVLGAGLVAAKLNIPVGHIEAGLRSYDRSMPEELNRILVDHLSSKLFCPTNIQMDILQHEGINKNFIEVTGNTIVEAVQENLQLIEAIPSFTKEPYVILTLHRPSNVDEPGKLKVLLESIQHLSKENQVTVFFPLHPRTEKIMDKSNLKRSLFHNINFIDPQPYLSMLKLLKESKLVLTDSGGIQEEACVLQVPCITLRENTERPETLAVGANRLSGPTIPELQAAWEQATNEPRHWKNPFGDGTASIRILNSLLGKDTHG